MAHKDAPSGNHVRADDRGPTGCPLTAALRAIGGKWNLICLYWLETESRRFNELRRLMPDISHKVLTETLREYVAARETLVPEIEEAQDDLFLPFEGDNTLSIIISKAFLLAGDARIEDPTITRQIDSR